MRPLPPRPGTKATNNQFSIKPWDGSQSGEKIILYAETGMGKTTLASMAPNPTFIGLDDGGRKIQNPLTGEWLNALQDENGNLPSTFEQVRTCLNSCLEMDCESVVLDTGTIFQQFAENYIIRTVKVRNAKGQPAVAPDHIEDYGWGKGYKHLWDAMRLPLLDFDKLIAAGKNVIIIAQKQCHKCTTDTGDEYLREGPEFYHSEKNWSVLKSWTEWADHIFRIRHQHTVVPKDKKKAVGDKTHVIDTKEDNSYLAKSRTLDEPVISFSDKYDDSLWKLLFPSKYE